VQKRKPGEGEVGESRKQAMRNNFLSLVVLSRVLPDAKPKLRKKRLVEEGEAGKTYGQGET